jgi:hypothetical protein
MRLSAQRCRDSVPNFAVLNSCQRWKFCIRPYRLEYFCNLVFLGFVALAYWWLTSRVLPDNGHLLRRDASRQQEEDKEDSVLVSHDLG